MGFHADPTHLFYDPASGDGGLGLYGHSHTTAAFLVYDIDIGFLCYFCDVFVRDREDGTRSSRRRRHRSSSSSSSVTLMPRDSYRRAAYLAPLGLFLVSEAGVIATVTSHINATLGPARISAIEVQFAPADEQPLDAYRLRLEVRAGRCSVVVAGGLPKIRGAYEAPLTAPIVRISVACPDDERDESGDA